jgi:hypothetical protein
MLEVGFDDRFNKVVCLVNRDTTRTLDKSKVEYPEG